MLVVVAVIKAKAGMEQEVENAIKAIIPKVEAEEGTLAYTLHRGKREPGKFLIYEKYTNKEAFTAHASTLHFKELFQKITPLLDGAMVVDMYEDLAGITAKK
jgi:quinol monooxygenase YgiN